MEGEKRRRWILASVATAAVCGLAGCGADRSDVDVPTIRVAYPGSPDFGDVAAALAHERLRTAGYVIDERSFPTTEISVDALARGDVDVAFGSTRLFWAAIARGAPIRAVMEHVIDVHRLVVAGTPGCGAIGSRFALQSEGAAGTAMARAYLARACPGLDPDPVFVPGSTNRMTAMLSGALTATVLQLSDVVRLERLAPGQFVVMADFGREWPDVKTTVVHVNTAFATRYPGRIVDYVAARIAANRALAADDPLIVDVAARVLGDEPDWAVLAPIYRRLPAWHPDGGLSRASIAGTLDFLIGRTGLAPGLTVDQVADLSVLEAVLREEAPSP